MPGSRVVAPDLVGFGRSDKPAEPGDPSTATTASILTPSVPGAAGWDHPTITGAAHFPPEDAGPEPGAVIAEFVRSS